ncbi:MAG: TM2 domain-containing protein [Oscillospiraceae bacterium]|nr:TM2 domain-containing protein [Oscillospiraceae bacterium]
MENQTNGINSQKEENIGMAAGEIVTENYSNPPSQVNAGAITVVGGLAGGWKKSKWVCLLLWCFLGFVGGHKFYDGKIRTGLLYMFTLGLFFIGWIKDLFVILNRPNLYYV